MSTTVVVPVETPNGLHSTINRHFGHTRHFAVVQIAEGNRVALDHIAENPHLENHKPGEVPAFVKSLGADVILAGAMGQKAIQVFSELGIVVSQAQTDVVLGSVRAYIAGLLEEVEPCADHSFSDTCAEH